MMKLSDYVFDFLKNKGVKHCFMLPGGGAMHLVDSLGTSGIEYIPFLHEQGAAIAAEAYGQHTNTPGVLLVTSGPGGTNAITGVTAGWIDSTPMFVISGQAKRSDLVGDRGVRQIGSQEVQIIPMITSITKYAVQILEPEEIRYHLERAWHEATTGRPGPVWLDIPLDVQGTQIDAESLHGYEAEVNYAIENSDELGNHENPKGLQGRNQGIKSDGIIRDAEAAAFCTIELLRTSKKPLILAGNGINLSGAMDEFEQLIRMLDVPVQTTWKTIDMLGEDDPLYVGHPGIMGDRGANLIIQEADFLLSIGSRLDTSITAFNDEHFAFNAKKVIVDIDENELRRMGVIDSERVCCDAGEFIIELRKQYSQIVDSSKKTENTENTSDFREESFPTGSYNNPQNKTLMEDWGSWLPYCKKIREQHPVVTDQHLDHLGDVSAYYFIDVLCDLLREDDVIVPESSGGAGEITYQAFRIKKGQKMKNAAGLGSMGFGLPYAIGSCIANDRRRTILINGDGAFQLNIQELETAHRLDLTIKMFIWYNEGYASIRSMQRNNFDGRYVGSSADSGLTIPDLTEIAHAYGFKSVAIRDNGEVYSNLPQIMADDEPVLCVVNVDPYETVSPRVKAYVGENGQMTSGMLERMWPEDICGEK